MKYLVYVHESTPNPDRDRLFEYPLDSGKDFDYPARVSSNYFFFGKGRNVKGGRCERGFPKPGSIIYSFHHNGDPLVEALKERDVVIIRLDSLWDFYKAIGYDYKKQKWLNKNS